MMVMLLTLLAWSPSSAQYAQRVLIEEFTSATCGPCVQATPILNEIVNTYQGKVVTIRYHVNLPVAGDPWYDASFIEPMKTKYGISGSNGPPKAFVNGRPVNPTDKAAVKDLVDQALATGSTPSPIKVDVTQTIEGGNVKLHVVATAGPDGLTDGYKLRVVLMESYIHVDELKIPAWNHETEYYDVPRAILPSPTGGDITLGANESKSFDYTVPVNGSWQTGMLYASAFVEDGFSSDVVQMGNSPRPVAGVSRLTDVKSGYALMESAPNPASGSATIGYTLGASERVMITLHNANGDRVLSSDQGLQESGVHHATVDLSTLPAGVYSYTVTAGSWTSTKMLTVVR